MATQQKAQRDWVKWLDGYGAEKFLGHFLRNVEGAKGRCIQCGQDIFVDVLLGGGIADWSTDDGDFGCINSPDTCEDGTGGHMPERR